MVSGILGPVLLYEDKLMSGRILPFDGSEHAAADVLLPFYVNGTLHGEELAFVEQHVLACEACRQEADWLRLVYAACAASPLLQDAAHAVSAAHAGSASHGPVEYSHAQHGIRRRIREDWRRTRPWTRWLIAAQLAAIAVLGGIVTTEAPVAPYRTLGGGNASAHMRDTVAVMFDPSISAAELRRIVLAANARIVDGPSATDVFVLEVPPDRIRPALALLRKEPAVRLAEPLGPSTKP